RDKAQEASRDTGRKSRAGRAQPEAGQLEKRLRYQPGARNAAPGWTRRRATHRALSRAGLRPSTLGAGARERPRGGARPARSASGHDQHRAQAGALSARAPEAAGSARARARSEEHTSELQSRENLVCRLLLEKK